MDAKIDHSRVGVESGTQQRASRRRVFSYIQELKEELKKVSWTTQEELKFSTKMVVGSMFALGISIYLVDLVIKGCLDLIGIIAHFIFG